MSDIKNNEAGKNYIVVFEYTAEAGGYEGVRTISSFPSKEYFDNWYTEDLKKHEKVVEEGVSEQEAQRLCAETPTISRISAAIQEAMYIPGKVDFQILKFQLANAGFGFNDEAEFIQEIQKNFGVEVINVSL